MQFDLRKYKDRKYVMHCKSKKEAVKFLTYLRKHDYVWCTGDDYTEYNTEWDNYKEKTCYYFNDGTYGSYDTACDRNRIILEYSDFDWDNNVGIPTLTEDDHRKFDDFITSCIGLESVVNL